MLTVLCHNFRVDGISQNVLSHDWDVKTPASAMWWSKTNTEKDSKNSYDTLNENCIHLVLVCPLSQLRKCIRKNTTHETVNSLL